MDESAERIINYYLAERHGVEINAVFFRYCKLSDGKERAGATTLAELTAHVDPFANAWIGRHGKQYSEAQHQAALRGIRGPI